METSYGSHVIRLVRSIPARHLSLADARPELQAGTLELWRKRELERYIRELIEKAHLELFPDHLARAAQATTEGP